MKLRTFGKSLGLLLLLTLLGQVSAFAQQKVKGNVQSADKEPLIGVTVQLKGTSEGTVTDLDGNYEIMAAAKDILVFSYTGFASQEIPVGDRTEIDVVLEVSDVMLEELAPRRAPSEGALGCVDLQPSLHTTRHSIIDVGSRLRIARSVLMTGLLTPTFFAACW